MRPSPPVVVAFLFGLMLALPGSVAAQSLDNEIAVRIARIESAPDPGARVESAAHLAEYIASRTVGDVSNVDPPIIDDMAQLLDDNDDWVRFYVAASLGFLGSSARRAIPALERALERREAERGIEPGQPRVFVGLSSAQAICAALTKIDLSRIPVSCQTYR